MSTPSTDSRRTSYSRPQVPARIGLVVVALFAGTIGAWSAFAPLSDAAVAEGVLQVQGRRQEVQHPYGGVIRELRVAEGDTVAEGDIVMTLSDVKPKAELDVLLAERDRLLLTRARLAAEREGSSDITPPEQLSTSVDDGALAGEQAILETRNRQHTAAVEVLNRQADQLREQITGAEAEIAGLERQIALTLDELEGARSLLEEGLTARPRVLGLERNASQLRGALGSTRADIAGQRQAIAETDAEIARLERARLAEIASETGAVDAKLAEIGPKIATAEDTLRYTEITAPASGRVVELAVFTEGGVIEPGARLMSIVPSDAPYFVDARLPLGELHGIEAGQVARIELLSMPRRERPDIEGLVRTVSADRIVDDRTGEGYYALQITLDAPPDGFDVALQAGMPVQVIMPTGPRTLIDYLTSPLLDEVSTAFREH